MSEGLWVLLGVFTLAAVLGAPLGLAMLTAGYVYLISTHQDVGLVVDQTMNGLYNSYLLIAVPMFIFVANIMNASGVIERLMAFGAAMVGHLPGGLAQVNVVTNLIFSGMSGSAVADASGPGLVLARMMAKQGHYPRGFAAATSVVSATLGAADANLYPDDLLRTDRQCFGRRHVSWRARSGGLNGAVADDRHRRHRAPPRFSARKAYDMVADAGGARPRAAGDCAAGNSARTDLFRHHHADRGGGHRCDLCLVAGADRLSHAEPVAITGSHIRHGAGDGDDRTHHVRSVRF